MARLHVDRWAVRVVAEQADILRVSSFGSRCAMSCYMSILC